VQLRRIGSPVVYAAIAIWVSPRDTVWCNVHGTHTCPLFAHGTSCGATQISDCGRRRSLVADSDFENHIDPVEGWHLADELQKNNGTKCALGMQYGSFRTLTLSVVSRQSSVVSRQSSVVSRQSSVVSRQSSVVSCQLRRTGSPVDLHSKSNMGVTQGNEVRAAAA